MSSIVSNVNEKLLSISNALHLREYPHDNYEHILGYGNSHHKLSRLLEIVRLRIADVEQSKKPIDTQGCGLDRTFYVTKDELYEDITDLDEALGKPLNLIDCIYSTYPKMTIAAEFKKASPSKGDINVNSDPVEQCLIYANAGVAVISVLTEFRHFKGTLNDLKRVRKATQLQIKEHQGSRRPAILRKDFIVDRYQILEARASGADTILLMVSILGVNQLIDLLTFSRELGMEPLVEVASEQEMEIAIHVKAKVIGVNNRNLHTFQLNLDTTHHAVRIADKFDLTYKLSSQSNINVIKDHSSKHLLLASLSGITSPSDVKQYYDIGISCCLVGEALMKSSNPHQTIQELVNIDSIQCKEDTLAIPHLVKLCGFKCSKDVSVALQNGANMIGLIFAPKSPRCVSIETAQEIVTLVRNYGERSSNCLDFESITSQNNILSQCIKDESSSDDVSSVSNWFNEFGNVLKRITVRKPLVVGVFQDQSVDYINEVVAKTGIDVIQLHGNETPEFTKQLRIPFIKVLHLPAISSTEMQSDEVDMNALFNDIKSWSKKSIAILLDSKLPGSSQGGGGIGKEFDWNIVDSVSQQFNGLKVLLAGGLNVENVHIAANLNGVLGVDVSSGIESSPGNKDPNLIKQFLENIK